MRESLEPDSNVTRERDSHFKKHPGLTFSTEAGMEIDDSDEQDKKAPP
jgi:hypothetical protein